MISNCELFQLLVGFDISSSGMTSPRTFTIITTTLVMSALRTISAYSLWFYILAAHGPSLRHVVIKLVRTMGEKPAKVRLKNSLSPLSLTLFQRNYSLFSNPGFRYYYMTTIT